MPDTDLQAFIDAPQRWPLRPLLPMKRIGDPDVACAYLMEQRGLTLYFPDGSIAAAFNSVAELREAGWQID